MIILVIESGSGECKSSQDFDSHFVFGSACTEMDPGPLNFSVAFFLFPGSGTREPQHCRKSGGVDLCWRWSTQ